MKINKYFQNQKTFLNILFFKMIKIIKYIFYFFIYLKKKKLNKKNLSLS